MITEKITYICDDCDFICFGITKKEKHESLTGHRVHKHIELIKNLW